MAITAASMAMTAATFALLATALPAALANEAGTSVGFRPSAIPVPPPGGSGIPKQCTLPSDTGPCDGDFKRYYFRPFGGCQTFQYGGCDGNANNFETLAECEGVCLGLNLPVRPPFQKRIPCVRRSSSAMSVPTPKSILCNLRPAGLQRQCRPNLPGRYTKLAFQSQIASLN